MEGREGGRGALAILEVRNNGKHSNLHKFVSLYFIFFVLINQTSQAIRMTIETPKNKNTEHLHSIGNESLLQSPILPSPRLSIAVDLDREIVRSVSCFGDTESAKDLAKRIPSFNHLDSRGKRAARDRRRFLLTTKALQPEKFESIVNYYGLEATKKDLSLDFRKSAVSAVTSSTKKKNMDFSLVKPMAAYYAKKKNGKALKIVFFV